MTLTEALLYGFVQGLTEYLPISSSAHLILLPRFLATEDPGLAFDVFLHLGTLFATLIYFRREWIDLFWRRRELIRDVPGVTVGKVALATLPALIAGVLIHGFAETAFRGNIVLMTTLVVGGIVLWATDAFCPSRRDLRTLRNKDALIVGCIQCLALIPGMSRSGSTLIAGRVLGFDRSSAARFSFLISAPVTAAALLFEARKLFGSDGVAERVGGWAPLLMGALGAFLFGWIAIDLLLRWVRRRGYVGFMLYRFALAYAIGRVLL